MPLKSKERCERAIAYIKPSGGPEIPLVPPVKGVPETEYPVLEDLGNGLLVAYLWGEEEDDRNFSYIRKYDLIDSGWTHAQLHACALKNLMSLPDKPLMQPYGDHFRLFYDVNFGAALILIDDLWDRQLNQQTPNGIVLAIPNREVLAFCDAHSSAGIEQLRMFVAAVLDPDHPIGDHPISSQLYIRDRNTQSWKRYVH